MCIPVVVHVSSHVQFRLISYSSLLSDFSLSSLQSDDQCCNSCEEVREAYRKKGWAMTNMDLIDQVSLKELTLFFMFYVKTCLCVKDSISCVFKK